MWRLSGAGGCRQGLLMSHASPREVSLMRFQIESQIAPIPDELARIVKSPRPRAIALHSVSPKSAVPALDGSGAA